MTIETVITVLGFKINFDAIRLVPGFIERLNELTISYGDRNIDQEAVENETYAEGFDGAEKVFDLEDGWDIVSSYRLAQRESGYSNRRIKEVNVEKKLRDGILYFRNVDHNSEDHTFVGIIGVVVSIPLMNCRNFNEQISIESLHAISVVVNKWYEDLPEHLKKCVTDPTKPFLINVANDCACCS